MSISSDVAMLHRAVRTEKKNYLLESLSKVSQEDLKVPTLSGNTVLHLLFENKNLTEEEIIELAETFLDRGIDVNAENGQGITALHRAIKRRMKGVVELLLKREADIYKCDREGNSVAHGFVDSVRPLGETTEKTINFIEFLIEKGVSFDLQNKSGLSALHRAIKYDDSQHIVHLLLVKYTQDIHFVDRKNKTLLHMLLEERGMRRNSWEDDSTCRTSRYVAESVKTLLDRGVSTWSRDSDLDRTCLQVAIQCKEHMSIIKMLVDHRLKNMETNLATDVFLELLKTCSWWNESKTEYFLNILRSLIDKGADVNAKDKSGTTPAYIAVRGENVRVIDFLYDHGADFGASNEDGQNLYHALATSQKSNTKRAELESLFDFVASKGCCDVKARNSANETPLHLAARCENPAIACKLIAGGAKVNCKDKNGCTPLYHAIYHSKSEKMAELVLKSGADVNCKDKNGLTPLHYAVCHSKTVKLAELLLESGAEVNSKDKRGRRPLDYAVDGSDVKELVPLLLKRGAYVNNARKESDLPLRKCVLRGNLREAKEMLAYGANVNHEAVVCSINSDEDEHGKPSWLAWSPQRWDRQFVMQHWMRLRAAKLPYSPEYEVYDPQLHEDCLNEIEMLKDTFIGGRISIYSFLHMNFGCRRRYVNNEELRRLIQSTDLERKFPNYSVVILASYRETVLWKSLLERAKRAWLQLTNIKLPGECIEIIFAHLRNEDLVRMIEHRKNV